MKFVKSGVMDAKLMRMVFAVMVSIRRNKMNTQFKIGDEVLIHGYVDEIRNDTIIIKNQGGYFGTVASEIKKFIDGRCAGCKWFNNDVVFCSSCCVGKINFYEPIKKKEENRDSVWDDIISGKGIPTEIPNKKEE